MRQGAAATCLMVVWLVPCVHAHLLLYASAALHPPSCVHTCTCA